MFLATTRGVPRHLVLSMDGDSASKKTENNVPVGRLPSMRPPRDLTLRGAVQGLRGDPLRRGSTKRTFAPIIPNAPIKKERLDVPVEPEKPKQNESSHSRKRSGDRGDRGGRGRGRGQGRGSNLVYQKSIFEEWSNNKPKAAGPPSLTGGGGGRGGLGSYYSRGSSSGESSSNFIKVKDEVKDEGETDEILKDIYRDDFLDDESLSTTNPAMFPVLLDIQKKECKEELTESKPPLVASSNTDIKVKEEPKDLGSSNEPIHRKPKVVVPWDPEFQLPAVEQIFTPVTSSKKLFFIHLPDILPGHPPSKNSAPSTSTGTNSQSNQTTGKSQTEAETEAHSLNDFTEGFLGKMKVRRSGKVEFELGSVTFEGSPLPSTFLQEVVVCEVENNPDPKAQKWGDMTVIGHIGHKIQFTPNIDAILENISS